MSNSLNINADSPIPLADVPGLLPKRRGKKVHHSTIYRWATKGARGRVLESRMIGGVRYTSLAALNRFLDPATSNTEDNQRNAIKKVLYGDT